MPYLAYCKRCGYWETGLFGGTREGAEEVAEYHHQKTGHSPIYIIFVDRETYAKYELMKKFIYGRQIVASRLAKLVRLGEDINVDESSRWYRYV